MKKILSILLVTCILFVSAWAVTYSDLATKVKESLFDKAYSVSYTVIELDLADQEEISFNVNTDNVSFVFGELLKVDENFRSPASIYAFDSIKINNTTNMQELIIYRNDKKSIKLVNLEKGLNVVQIEYFKNENKTSEKTIKLINNK